MECFSRVDSPDGRQSGSVPCATLSQNSENLSAFRQPERWLATKGGSAQALDHMRAERTDQPRSREGGRADVSELLNRCFVVAGSGQGPPQEKLVQAAPACKPIATRQVDVQLGKIGGGDHRAPPHGATEVGHLREHVVNHLVGIRITGCHLHRQSDQGAWCGIACVAIRTIRSGQALAGRERICWRNAWPRTAVAVVALSARWLHLRRLTSDRRKLEDSAIW